MKEERFQFAPSILVRLGEELLPKPEQALVELVRNAYDADALTCTVKLMGTDRKGGSILIHDDGIGMDYESIRSGWFIIGGSQKAEQGLSLKFQRPLVGDKGIGRLAALRLGTQVELKTRPESKPGTEYIISIDWSAFSSAKTIEEVRFDVYSEPTKERPGTDILIKNLRIKLDKRDVDRLARELVLLADPFMDTKEAFKPRLIAPGFTDLEKKIRNGHFEDAEYYLKASIDSDGLAHIQLFDWTGKVCAVPDEKDFKKRYKTTPAEFELWWFKLSAESFSNRKAKLKEVRAWLAAVGGVHIYHRGLRVRPYGDPGYDWLDMNLARARSPEERPSTNNTVGRVIATDLNGQLVQKTDRIGFIEGASFLELKRFAKEALEWMSKHALRVAERRRQSEREQAPKRVKETEERLFESVSRIRGQQRKDVERLLKRYKKFNDERIKTLGEDLQLYRSLATAGIISATFSHETSRPLNSIREIANVIEHQAFVRLKGEDKKLFEKPIEMLRQISESLLSFVNLPINLLKRAKRKPQLVHVDKVAKEVLKLFDPFFGKAKIRAQLQKPDEDVTVRGSIALVEAIITNLLTNAVKALDSVEADDRLIIVRLERSMEKELVVLTVMDSGPGIQNIGLEEIWLPGRTTSKDGTGFGLTIVKDSVIDLGGEVRAIKEGAIGGTEVIVTLPLVKSDSRHGAASRTAQPSLFN